MFYALLLLLFLGLIYGPQLWVRYILYKHNEHLDGMPGTGAELAQHLLSEYKLELVKVEKASANDNHYSPEENAVRLAPDIYDGKSLTAIAVAAHEVGHAIQFNRREPVSLLRKRYMRTALLIRRFGMFVFVGLPLLSGILHLPHLAWLSLVAGVVSMLVSVLLYVAILPEEYDASFNKALPMLDQGDYVPKVYLPAIRQILKACALTYVAAALTDVLRLWRWLRFIR